MFDNNIIYYFTDASISNNYDIYGNIIDVAGSASFIKMKRNGKIISDSLMLSQVDIHYLEALAIRMALIDIDSETLDRAYCIFTDSDAAYSTLKRLYDLDNENQLSTFTFNGIFHCEIYNTYMVLKKVLENGFDIQIYCCKSHTDPEFQLAYFKRKGVKINLSDARFICHGNRLADKGAYLVSKERQLLNNYIPTITPCNWCIRL